jgi:hypothetical protein
MEVIDIAIIKYLQICATLGGSCKFPCGQVMLFASCHGIGLASLVERIASMGMRLYGWSQHADRVVLEERFLTKVNGAASMVQKCFERISVRLAKV